MTEDQIKNKLAKATKLKCVQALYSHADEKIKLREFTNGKNIEMKLKVMKAMLETCQNLGKV